MPHRTTVLLARHGETEWNASGRIQGHLDSPLTARGSEQHRHVAERLAPIGLAAVYSSSAGRARDLGEMIALQHGLSVVVVEGMRERSYGSFEGFTLDELREREGAMLEEWIAHPNRELLAPPGGETQPDMSRRVMAALREIVARHAGETVAVATHGGPIKSIISAVLEIPIAAWDRSWVSNGSLTTIRGTPDDLWVACFNDTCHLDSVAARPKGIGDDVAAD